MSEPDADGYRYISVVVVRFRRNDELFPLRKADADTVATALHDVL